jgi:hypothetical protein
MPFSAATCITFNPSVQTSEGPFDIYLDSDYTSTPFTSVTLTQITVNCPLIIQNIPNGTINLGIKDTVKDYCITIPIQDNDICTDCNLGLSQYSASTISKLYCGELTGSCQTITDYLINWYGPDDTTTLSFTSGSGSFVTSGVYQHPFSTEPKAIPVINGVYTPVIQKIILNGITYSNTGGVGTISFSGSCLPTTNILPLTCNVRTNPNYNDYKVSAYTNFLSFDSYTQGTPKPVTTVYKISAATKYIVWSFLAKDKSDRITILFSGSSYGTNKIGLEDIVVGSDVPNSEFNSTTYPKSADTQNSFVKFTCLTGLTVNNNDNIIITITPADSNTVWSLYMSCLDNYNCNDCLNTNNYKIIGSSITGITKNCSTIDINFNISGCSRPDLSSDLITYYTNNDGPINTNIVSSTGVYSNILSQSTGNSLTDGNLYYSNVICTNAQTSILSNCTQDLSPTMYDKTFLPSPDGRGVFGFTGSSTFISTYYNSIKNSFLGISPYNNFWSGSTSNTDLSYYRGYTLKIPSTTSTDDCGDKNAFITPIIHHTSPYSSGQTISGDYYLKITANTISSGITFTSCDVNCTYSEDNTVTIINNNSKGNQTPYATNKVFPNGTYYTNPIVNCNFTVKNIQSSTAYTNSGIFFLTSDWSFNTYPFSGNPSTFIPSLSGTVCNYTSRGSKYNSFNSSYQKQFKFYYQLRLINELNVRDFEILVSPITNFAYSGSTGTALYDLAYRYSGGSVTYSNSTYII